MAHKQKTRKQKASLSRDDLTVKGGGKFDCVYCGHSIVAHVSCVEACGKYNPCSKGCKRFVMKNPADFPKTVGGKK